MLGTRVDGQSGLPTVLDLSQSLQDGMPHGTTIPRPGFRQVLSLEEHGLRCMELTIPTHLGTHLDAPSHFLPDGATIDEIPASALQWRAVCVPVNVAADEPILVAHLQRGLEHVPPGQALLIHTGWGERFSGDDYLHHPYLAEETAAWIVQQGFGLVGVDTVTPDLPGPLRPRPFSFPVHHKLLGAGVLIVENLRLGQVAGQSFTLIIGALKVSRADGAPARVLAQISGKG